MDFFQSLSALQVQGDWIITVNTGTENSLVVSVLLNNEQCGDKAKKLIPPLILRGTAQEIDTGFFENVTIPLQTTSGIMVNMESFLKQQELAKQQSAMEKEKTDKANKQKDTKEKAFKESMLKVDELEKEQKYKDAWMKVPDPAQYPEHIELIRKRRSELSAKFQPDLFATPVAEPPKIEFEIGDGFPDDEEQDEIVDGFEDQEDEDY